MNNVTCVTVNFNTPHLIKKAIKTFNKFYNINIVLIDNASKDASCCIELQQEFDNITLILNNKNIGHGPALHQGILIAETDYIFTLDSDTETCNGGFIEKMLLKFEEQQNMYAVGWMRYVNENGISGNHLKNKLLTPYIHPYASLIDCKKYLMLPKFENKGAPCTNNMRCAFNAGYSFFDFPIDKYITHLIAGTRRMLNGNWIGKNEDLKEWDKNASYRL